MDHGSILALGTPASLKASIGADTIVSVSTDGDTVGLGARLQRLPGAARVETGEGMVRVFMRGTDGVVPRVVNEAEAGGFRLTDVSVAEPTLETVFITLTGKELRE
jgi:ABC-2 type transport system ATP-binding protein